MKEAKGEEARQIGWRKRTEAGKEKKKNRSERLGEKGKDKETMATRLSVNLRSLKRRLTNLLCITQTKKYTKTTEEKNNIVKFT